METIAAVVLPEPTHFIGRLPEGDDDFTTRVRLLKDVGDVFIAIQRSFIRVVTRQG